MSPRLATFLMFVVNGAVVGTWIAAIPGTKANLGASGADFGLALLCAPLGALVAQQIAGQGGLSRIAQGLAGSQGGEGYSPT